jgi:hypothetical protein
LVTSFGNEKALGEIEELEIATAKHHPSRFAVAFEVTAEPGNGQHGLAYGGMFG